MPCRKNRKNRQEKQLLDAGATSPITDHLDDTFGRCVKERWPIPAGVASCGGDRRAAVSNGVYNAAYQTLKSVSILLN